jgi:hypothetical protein
MDCERWLCVACASHTRYHHVLLVAYQSQRGSPYLEARSRRCGHQTAEAEAAIGKLNTTTGNVLVATTELPQRPWLLTATEHSAAAPAGSGKIGCWSEVGLEVCPVGVSAQCRAQARVPCACTLPLVSSTIYALSADNRDSR